ncbi:MAG: SPOR domain-containing protein [Legionellaceae bacterium]|nr:SPOR domain-containing protein [Legionellaceae bacterium]
MNIPIRILSITLSTLILSACMVDGTDSSSSSFYPFGTSEPSQPMLYPEGYDTVIAAPKQESYQPTSSKNVVVPQSYHMSAGSPETSKDVDKNWVASQNPQSYTIELADDSKASRVANTLYKAPKTERSAEVRTQNGNYKGLYGTYPTYEAAQEKLNSLPEDVKQGAGIKAWSNVQRDLQ